MIAESGDRFTRKRLLRVAAGGATAAVGAALVTPAASLGPLLRVNRLAETPWHRGVRLVDEHGRPLRAGDIEPESFYTAFPQGASRELLGAPLVLVRIDPGDLQLPRGREGWAPDGILAYSKICTHAGCSVALYRAPLYEPTSSRPALVCPCHYSTFDPARGAKVLFGPAGRPLPQLPLTIDGGGRLIAAGGFSGRIGPSWWGVRFR
jgi:ubiquinol-cytochrome c reductase iron-sulfur subunit